MEEDYPTTDVPWNIGSKSVFYTDLKAGVKITLVVNHNRVKRKVHLSSSSEGAMLLARVYNEQYRSYITGQNQGVGIFFYVSMDEPYNKNIGTYHNEKWRKLVIRAVEDHINKSAPVQFLQRVTGVTTHKLTYSLAGTTISA